MTNTRGVDFSEQGDYVATRAKELQQATSASEIHYDVAGVTLVFDNRTVQLSNESLGAASTLVRAVEDRVLAQARALLGRGFR